MPSGHLKHKIAVAGRQPKQRKANLKRNQRRPEWNYSGLFIAISIGEKLFI